MRGRLTLIAIASAALVVIGCSVADPSGVRRSLYVDQHPELSESTAEAIINGRVMVGMTQEMVEVSWGKPSRVELVKDDPDITTQWIYGNYFTAGTVTSLFFDGDGLLMRYEVKDQKAHGNSGSLSLAGNKQNEGMKVGSDGTLEKGSGQRP